MTWKHYPNSPFGNIDICDHGCTRNHGDIKRNCINCDYPKEVLNKLIFSPCSNKCKSFGVASITWHYHGLCLKCQTEEVEKILSVIQQKTKEKVKFS
jgi:hypothetical protein